MKLAQKLALAVPALLLGTHALADATFFSREGFRGESIQLDHRTGNFEREGFNDRASSARIDRGAWEVCEHPRFEGRCVVLRRGNYPSLRAMGLDNSISSARPLERDRDRDRDRPQPVYQPVPAPMPAPQPAVQVIYEVPVVSARAVMGPPQQRCWIEREQVSQPGSGQPNVGGAIVGGVIGGVLGNQIGKGSGRDVATAGGAVAGAVIGSQVGTSGGATVVERDVQRCTTAQQGAPAYWDVVYLHQGMERRVQLQQAPGRTLRLNAQGQPML
jgi:uncharacterized protein YcfJ